jgi:hypothetical protein
LVDFGPNDDTHGHATTKSDSQLNYWNNWSDTPGGAAINAGEHLGNLLTNDEQPSGIDLVVTGGFTAGGIRQGGLLDPSPDQLGDFAIESVTEDFFLADEGNAPGGFMLRGLDPARRYELGFFASRRSGNSRTTRFTVVGAATSTADLQTSGRDIGSDGVYDGNDSQVARMSQIAPDRFGQLYIDVAPDSGAGTAYINAFELRVVPEPHSVGLAAWAGLAMAAAARNRRRYANRHV